MFLNYNVLNFCIYFLLFFLLFFVVFYFLFIFKLIHFLVYDSDIDSFYYDNYLNEFKFNFIVYLDYEQSSVYESGAKGLENTNNSFLYIQFYLIAVLFLVFDIEIVYFYPWIINFLLFFDFYLIIFFIFFLFLIVGLFYEIFCGSLSF